MLNTRVDHFESIGTLLKATLIPFTGYAFADSNVAWFVTDSFVVTSEIVAELLDPILVRSGGDEETFEAHTKTAEVKVTRGIYGTSAISLSRVKE